MWENTRMDQCGIEQYISKTETSFENVLMERDSNETATHNPLNTSSFFYSVLTLPF